MKAWMVTMPCFFIIPCSNFENFVRLTKRYEISSKYWIIKLLFQWSIYEIFYLWPHDNNNNYETIQHKCIRKQKILKYDIVDRLIGAVFLAGKIFLCLLIIKCYQVVDRELKYDVIMLICKCNTFKKFRKEKLGRHTKGKSSRIFKFVLII